MFAPHETLPVTACIGRACGQPTVSCPPAIPIAVSGEVITEDLIPVFLAYGVSELSVVKKTGPDLNVRLSVENPDKKRIL